MTGTRFGDLVRSARHEAGLTQEELSAASGVSVRAIVDLERGQVRSPRSDTVRRIADACGLAGAARARFVAAARDSAGTAPGVRTLPSVPAQLPAALAVLPGRTEALTRMDDLLTRARSGRAGPVIAALHGTAGVGKTALAVHWAHRVREHFPDGQLYVDLRGFEPVGEPRSADDAVRGFLEALGVRPHEMPDDREARVGRYRSVTTGRRILVLLDNARDAAQVRPLIPGTPSAFVVVTSRDHLTGLVAAEGAVPVKVELLDDEGARAVLRDRLGAECVAAEPEAVGELTTRAVGLPLALAVIAARAGGLGVKAPLTTVAGELRAARGSLDPLAGSDPATDVRTVLSGSFRMLGPAAARVFRLLALYPANEFSDAAIDSLAGCAAGPAPAELVTAGLISPAGGGRYTWHDLLRAYSIELAAQDDAELAPARRRMLDHLVHTAHAADRLLIPSRDPIRLDPPSPGTVVGVLEDRDAALAWFRTERPALLAAVDAAAEAGLDRHAWQLAWGVLEYLDRWGYWNEAAHAHEVALVAADRLADPVAQAFTHRGLGRSYGRLRRLDRAESHLEQSARIFTDLGSHAGAARTHLSLAGLAAGRHVYEDAVHHAARALDLFRLSGSRIGVGNALNTLGWYESMSGDHRTALPHQREALSVLEPTGDTYGLAATWEGLGVANHGLGLHAEAVDCYRRALELYESNDDRFGRSDTMEELADAYDALGESAAAQQARYLAERIRAL
jgi:tetratricopeptide (TPR) repeat protein/transcriptional regulator with XRE-family HTH domain